MTKSTKKFIIVLIVIVLTLVGLFLFNKYRNIVVDRNQLYINSEKYNEEVRELRKEQAALNEELNDLYEELYTGGLGSTIILLADTHVSCLDDAVAMLDWYGYKGVIALSSLYMPDDNHKNYLTREQVDELVDNGYEIVIKATNEELEKTYERFNSLGYDVKGFYFEDMAVNSLMVEQIRNIDENLVVIGNHLEGVGITDSLLIPYYGSRQSNVRTYYEESIDKSEVVALTVGYNKSVHKFEENNFTNMLNIVQEYEWYGETEVCTISGAVERNDIYLEKLAEIEPETYERVEEIKNRLEEISQEIMDKELK